MPNIWKLLSLLLVAAIPFIFSPVLALEEAGPERVLKSYLRAMYARDASAAYTLISQTDKHEKSFEDYRAETGSYEGAVLAVSLALSQAIRFEKMSVKTEEDRATVSFAAQLPDANAVELEPIVQNFDKDRLGKLSPAALAGKLKTIREMVSKHTLSVIQSTDERWELVREPEGWRVFVNWAEAVEVRFSAATSLGLGWEFEPVRKRILAKPGETIEMAYRVRNTGTVTSTGKASHVIGPHGLAEHLEIVSCFCFLEQTLAPGQEMLMPLVFRVGFDAPEAIRNFNIHYDFYPLKKFPGGAAG